MTIRAHKGLKATTFQVVVEGPKDEFGKRTQVPAGTYPTRAEAETAELKAMLSVREGTWSRPRKGTVGQVFARWVEQKLTLGRIADASAYRYMKFMEKQFAALEDVPVAKLTPDMIVACYERERKRKIKGTTLFHAHCTLKSCLQTLVDADELPRHPMRNLPAPKKDSPETASWTLAQAERFLRVEEGQAYYPLWRLLLETGMRIGELQALRWRDVELQDEPCLRIGARITIRRRPDGTKEAVVHDGTKTDDGRGVAFSPQLAQVLIAHKGALRAELAVFGVKWSEDRFVFPNADRSGYVCSDVARRALKAACIRAGVPEITPHGFRHTNASRAVGAGEPLPVVMERLGQKRIETIAGYLHTAPAEHRRVADLLGTMFAPSLERGEKNEHFLTDFLTDADDTEQE